jgi:hypothetical protein
MRGRRFVRKERSIIMADDQVPDGPALLDARVQVRSMRNHTYDGSPRKADHTYMVFPDEVENLRLCWLAYLVPDQLPKDETGAPPPPPGQGGPPADVAPPHHRTGHMKSTRNHQFYGAEKRPDDSYDVWTHEDRENLRALGFCFTVAAAGPHEG